MVLCETWFPGTNSSTPETWSPQVPLPGSGSYTEDQESFLGSCVLQKLNLFTFFFIQLAWLFPLLWSCVRGPFLSTASTLQCLSIGLLYQNLLSFRSKTCLIFLSILLVQSLWSLDHVRFILSRDRSQLEDCSSESELFSLISGLFLRHPFEAPAVCCVLRGGCTDERDTAFPQGELRV